MYFEIVGSIAEVEVIAAGSSIRERRRLWRAYGRAPWKKLKGIANIRLEDGTILRAELPWYEAHGVGRKECKIKRFLAQEE